MEITLLDYLVFFIFVGGVALFGCSFYFRSRKGAAAFTAAEGSLPTWVVGMSIFATFVSSISFLGLPGDAYKGNWNPFVFSLSIPIATWLAAKVFIPLYRGIDSVSAYHYLEMRFGYWARCYVAVCYLLTQLARVGSILLLLALPLVIGTEQYGATNWIRVGGMSLQPSEVVKLALLLILRYFISHRRLIPWLVFCLYCLGVLMLQKDLGTALIYYFTALFMYYACTGNLLMTGVGLVGAAGASVLGYQMFASGGLFGVGLGLGAPRVIPVYFTDCIFAVICEQFGIIFGVLVLVMYVILILRGSSIAVSARHSFHGLLAMGATSMLGIQTFVIIGGVLKLIPLTGVTMPFVSYGGTSMVSCMGLIGLLQGVASVNQDDLSYDYDISRSVQEMDELPEA